MGADLVSMCMVHPNGPLTQAECYGAIEYLKHLREQVAALHVEDFDVDHDGGLPDTPVTQIIIQVAEDMNAPYEDAIHRILQVTANSEELVNTIYEGTNDIGFRMWGKVRIFYAGAMTWGDEPDGEGYQAMKWIFLLGADKAMGLE